MQFYAERKCSLLRGGYYDYRYQYVELFPIVTRSKLAEATIVKMVDNVLEMNESKERGKSF